jgi:hypothetical protein
MRRPCHAMQEIYYRHLYARCTPDLRQRCDSWKNYCELFGLLLQSKVNMQLPNPWLWDMIDEFIYQFQSFCQYRLGAHHHNVSRILSPSRKGKHRDVNPTFPTHAGARRPRSPPRSSTSSSLWTRSGTSSKCSGCCRRLWTSRVLWPNSRPTEEPSEWLKREREGVYIQKTSLFCCCIYGSPP